MTTTPSASHLMCLNLCSPSNDRRLLPSLAQEYRHHGSSANARIVNGPSSSTNGERCT